MRPIIKRILLVIFFVLLAVSIGFIGWASFPLGPGPDALQAMQSDSMVSVEKIQGWTVFMPANGQAETGFIFYPGGRVDYRSYAPVLKPLAEQGYMVVLMPMPLSLAVFAPDKAAEVFPAFPDIQNWAIGGHSLGGAMAARYCYQHPGEVKGLALWASYPADTDSLADRDLSVLSIFGSQDGQAEKLAAADNLLPADTNWVIIEGGNHAQFGDYGLQPGDGKAEISPRQQWDQVIAATSAFLQNISE
jgi:pimeloyl-ACP methyl ester carboxylesterase